MKTKNIVVLISLIIAGVVSFCWAKSITSTTSDVKNILFNVFSSITVVFLIELITFIRDLCKYSFLAGTYKRIKIFSEDPDRKSDSKYVDITQVYIDNKVNPEVTLHYVGDGKYQGKAFYDKGEKGKTSITLKLDPEIPMIGNGTYQYLDKTVIDLGSYYFQVDTDRKTIYIFHSNLLPSGLAKGYEIWKR